MTALQTEVLTTDELTKIARDQIDAFNKGDWEQLRALLTSDAGYHEFGTERKIEGPDQIIELFKGWKTAFPDAAGTVTSSVASGNTAVLELTWKGTHTGPLVTAAGTIPASGKQPGDTRRRLLRLRGRQDQGKPPLLRRDDTAQADRRRAQVAGGPRGTAAQAVGPLRRRFDRRHMRATPRY